MINEPKIVEIKEIIDETPTIKTFKFDWDMEKLGCPNPGEFLMVWNFKNEKPMSIAQINDNELAITVKNIGKFTSQLHGLKIGDQVGIRGSYGNGFNNSFEGKKILAIGGGVGMAPINAIASDLIEKGNNVDVVAAAVNVDELLYVDNLEKLGANVHPCTDDGSFGFKGFATDCTISLLEDSTYDYAFVCGPEIMMKGIFDILEDASISAQYSLERYMKCALGVCGQCCELMSTNGATFSTKKNEFIEYKKTISFEIWDTAGQEKYRSLAKMFFKDATVALIVYDITNKKSFEEIKQYWMNLVKENGPKEMIMYIVGNKSDLSEREAVNEEEVRNYAKSQNILFWSTSAKDATGINELFAEIGNKYLTEFKNCEEIKERKQRKKEASTVNLEKQADNNQDNNNKRGCCG